MPHAAVRPATPSVFEPLTRTKWTFGPSAPYHRLPNARSARGASWKLVRWVPLTSRFAQSNPVSSASLSVRGKIPKSDGAPGTRSEEHTSELQSHVNLV